MSATVGKVTVPDIGDFDDVPIIEILVSAGDTVSAEDPLVTLESDKATMDVPAPFGGVVRDISVSVGDSVSEGSELMTIEHSDGDAGAVARSAWARIRVRGRPPAISSAAASNSADAVMPAPGP